MSATQSQPGIPRHRRRCLQFGTRTMLLVVLICAIPCSWLAIKIDRARKQQAAVAKLMTLYGSAHFDYETGDPPVGLDTPTPPGPAWLREFLDTDLFGRVIRAGAQNDASMACLTAMPHLRDLYLYGEITDVGLQQLDALPQLTGMEIHSDRVTNTGLAHLKNLSRLQSLELWGKQPTDAGLKHLEGLNQLEVLRLRLPEMTDAGLEYIRGLTQLQELDLSQTHITDEGMRHLQGLKQLHTLQLSGTDVTDKGLEHLHGLPQLRVLVLYTMGSQISNQGVKRLQEALPNCKVQW